MADHRDPRQPRMRQSFEHTICDETEQALVSLAFERAGDAGPLVLAGKEAAAEAEAQRRELIERSRRGEQIELELTATTYTQRPGTTNRNFIEFSPGALRRLAKSGPGTPFLRDHWLWNTDASGGLTLATRLENGKDGSRSLLETMRLTVPWAVQAALDGRMSKFSIGVEVLGDPRKSIECTVCRKPAFECGHWPGKRIEGKDGNETRVTWRYLDAALIERSWVLYPAVQETETRGWRQLWVSLGTQETTVVDITKLRTILGLGADATEDEVLAKLEQLKAGAATGDAQRAKLEAERDTVRAERDTARAEAESLRGKLAEAESARLGAEFDGQIEALCKKGQLTPAQAQHVRERLAAGDQAGAKSLLTFASQASPTIVGAPRQAAPPDTSKLARTADGKVDFAALVRSLPEYERLSGRYREGAGAEAYCRTNWAYVAETLGLPASPDAL